MPIIKSFAVGNGDMYYIRHGSDSFTMIDCDLNDDNSADIIRELKAQSADKGIKRFISTHPDEDHYGGIHLLDNAMPIDNFYVVQNSAVKDSDTDSFVRYCQLRDGEKAFYLTKGCRRKWLNQSDDDRSGAGIRILWPDTSNADFQAALASTADGEGDYNNISAAFSYSSGDARFLWLGDLETDFMEAITDHIELTKTTVVFASHHGRESGKIPDSWLEKLDPQVIVLGEAPSRFLHYYTGYNIITQNSAGDLTMDVTGDRVHFYVSEAGYTRDFLTNERQNKFPNYIGSLTPETEYTL